MSGFGHQGLGSEARATLLGRRPLQRRLASLLIAPLPRLLRRHYSAERMSLVLLGGESLEELQSWVEAAFSGLPTGKGPRPDFSSAGMPFKVGRPLADTYDSLSSLTVR